MNGYFSQALKSLGAEPHVLWGSFAPNAASDPDTASNGGSPGLAAFTTAYAADGEFTVTLPEGLNMPGTPTILVAPQCASLATWFDVAVIGAYDDSARTFVVQAHRAGTGQEVAAAAGARIHFALLFNNSTGA